MATRETFLAETFLRLADTLVADFDVIDVLSGLSARVVELLDASASGIVVADPGGALQVVAASSDQASLLELFQVQNEEGPCHDAYRLGAAVVDPDLAVSTTWPSFAPLAVAAGFRSVYAFPMAVRTQVLGSVNLFLTNPGLLAADDVVIAQALAHAATLTLLQNQAAEDAHRLTSQLQRALNSRITVEQAKGVVSELAHVSTDEAFVRLRAFARGHNMKLTDLAAKIVRRTLAADQRAELLASAPISRDQAK
ncbi:GAF and ANTAR domain-containing protein [Acidiferrimicrobium sp. IK]|uniref:GAF and ANTAR domain-containing protein n=1 Tax=Acidiferrimicrobium sp. IK TaxID=2871700 RepID=UPI0021CB7423|nr:GAF and ANTAR domain-containing protein [Acidiferrimicrobium sp. IK]MCU4186062.1 GAF and ANTAR domain-containing protein [Acidiferrimicrobium sp. IK]